MAINNLERRGYRPNMGVLAVNGTEVIGRRSRKKFPCSSPTCSVGVGIDEDEVYVLVRVGVARYHEDECMTDAPEGVLASGGIDKTIVSWQVARKDYNCSHNMCSERIYIGERYPMVKVEIVRLHMACAVRHGVIERNPDVTEKVGRRAAIAMTIAKRAERELNAS